MSNFKGVLAAVLRCTYALHIIGVNLLEKAVRPTECPETLACAGSGPQPSSLRTPRNYGLSTLLPSLLKADVHFLHPLVWDIRTGDGEQALVCQQLADALGQIRRSVDVFARAIAGGGGGEGVSGGGGGGDGGAIAAQSL